MTDHVQFNDDEIEITVRLTRALKDRLLYAAQKEHRALNGQVVHLLEQALDAWEQPWVIWTGEGL